MLSTFQKTPVMKTGGNVKNIADEIILAQSAFVLYYSENLCSPNCMFHFDSSSGNLCVCLFLFGGQFLSLRLLGGLEEGYIGGVSLSVPS